MRILLDTHCGLWMQIALESLARRAHGIRMAHRAPDANELANWSYDIDLIRV